MAASGSPRQCRLRRSHPLIFVTVGTQLPFDRLIKIVDEFAPRLGERVFAQTGRGSYLPQNIDYQPFLAPAVIDGLMAESRVIVAHAGTGSMLTARKLGKPIIVFPRLAKLGEHRNDHQVATVASLCMRAGVYSALSAEDLLQLLSIPLDPLELPPPPTSSALTDHIGHWISTLRRHDPKAERD